MGGGIVESGFRRPCIQMPVAAQRELLRFGISAVRTSIERTADRRRREISMTFSLRKSIIVIALVGLCLILGSSLLQERRESRAVRWNDVSEYIPNSLVPLVSKDVIVRSVLFDDRSRSGHSNASVFMVEARRDIVDENRIVGCQVGEYVGKFIQVRPIALMAAFVHWKHSYVNHDLVMVDCFDLPVRNNSRAFLLFKKEKDSGGSRGTVLYSVESERPLHIPAPRIARGDDFKLLVCVATARYGVHDRRLTVYNMIYHWLRYQAVVGVDHVHIIAHPSFLRVGALQHNVTKRAIQSGFVSMDMWELWLNETDNYHGSSQMLAYQDCAYRFRGTYDYMMFCDTDDFFVPRIPSEKTFHYYIQHWCHYGACRFHWIERYPDCGLDWNQLGMDGNLTSILKSPTSLRRTDDKSLYKSAIVLDVGIHSPSETMSGYSTIHMPSNVAYFAHIRHAHTPQQGSAC